jgi:hypothetical protein
LDVLAFVAAGEKGNLVALGCWRLKVMIRHQNLSQTNSFVAALHLIPPQAMISSG